MDRIDNSRKLLRVKQVVEMTGIPRSTLYQMMSEGRFIKPVKLGERSVAWKLGEIIGWIDNLQESA